MDASLRFVLFIIIWGVVLTFIASTIWLFVSLPEQLTAGTNGIGFPYAFITYQTNVNVDFISFVIDILIYSSLMLPISLIAWTISPRKTLEFIGGSRPQTPEEKLKHGIFTIIFGAITFTNGFVFGPIFYIVGLIPIVIGIITIIRRNKNQSSTEYSK
jgi:hypothetical protein